MFVSLGICDFLKTLLPACKIKWPNDIYAGDDKIAGILIENSITGKTISSSVAGIGVNVNQEQFPDNVPNPVSLKMLTGNDYDLDSCLQQLAKCLDKRYKQVISGYRSEIRDEYTSSLYRLNAWHKFISENGEFSGRLLSVTDLGQMVIEEVGGKKREFSFREVEFRV
jgi:BirA family biotin operon repressor/biotin-[acetyl-CoA-carboxylase] ligase